MAGPVYKMFRARGKEAWFALSQEEQDGLTTQVIDGLKQAGGKKVLFCNSTWNSERAWAWVVGLGGVHDWS